MLGSWKVPIKGKKIFKNDFSFFNIWIPLKKNEEKKENIIENG